MTTTILLGADMIGLIPNRTEAILAQRARVCESLAVYCSVAAQKDDIPTVLAAMQILVKKNEDVLSAAVRREDGTVMVAAGDHGTNWIGAPSKESTPTHVRVPIFKGDSLWGMMEISFRPIGRGGIYGILTNTVVKLIGFVILLGFLTYSFFLKKTLRHLDPTTVVPPRVKAALDSLAEGIVLVNQEERIVLANAAFAEAVGKPDSSLLGRKVSELNWTEPNSKEPAQRLPWLEALRDKESQIGVRLGLPIGSGQWRTFMVNGAPILDSHEKCRGALATFDDVTKLEEQNEELQMMLKKLEQSRNEVRRKNKELKVLATRDPLTDCLNRRSFFESLEINFSAAQRYSYDLSCIMFDIDHFKSINDSHGHAAGDKVLNGLAGVVQSMLRTTDTICRYGGEEFCVILPHTDIDGASKAAERFRRQIESHDFSGVPVSVSLGVSSVALGASDPSELINQADQALYAAKNGGRNCVVSWQGQKSGTAMKHPEVTVPSRDGATAAKNAVSTNENTTLTAIVRDDAPTTEASVAQAPGQGSCCSDRSKDALEMVSDALKDSAKASRSIGLQVSPSNTEDAAVQLNQTGGWGDGGEVDEKDRLDTSSVSKAASVLKRSPKDDSPL
jgi:diguanylate cyclase (GGDEF)-like protein/PAS domain S-box-containing protein